MDSLEKIGKENQLSEIANVTLEIGEVSGVVDAYLKDCWKWAVRKSDLLKKAELITETIEAVTFCEDCGSTYSTVKLSLIHIYKRGRISGRARSEGTHFSGAGDDTLRKRSVWAENASFAFKEIM